MMGAISNLVSFFPKVNASTEIIVDSRMKWRQGVAEVLLEEVGHLGQVIRLEDPGVRKILSQIQR